MSEMETSPAAHLFGLSEKDLLGRACQIVEAYSDAEIDRINKQTPDAARDDLPAHVLTKQLAQLWSSREGHLRSIQNHQQGIDNDRDMIARAEIRIAAMTRAIVLLEAYKSIGALP